MKTTIYKILIVIIILAAGGVMYLMLVPAKTTITISPSEATVVVDGQQVGTGSAVVNLKYGEHTIEGSKDGYAGWREQLKVRGGQNPIVKINLAPLPVVKLIDSGVTSVGLSKDRKNILMSGDRGRIFYSYSISDGQKTQISRVDFGVAQRVKWSPNKYLAFIWRPDGTAGLADLKRYDLVNQEFKLWGKGNLDLAWSADGKEVVYIYKPGTGEFSLIQADAGNHQPDRIYDLRSTKITHPYLEWIKDGKQLMVADKDIYIYTFYTHELKQLTTSGDVKFGRLIPDSQTIIYATRTGLFKTDLSGNAKQLGQTADVAAWMPDGKAMVVWRAGGLININLSTGRETPYAYLGERLQRPEEMVVAGAGANIYLLIGNSLKALLLQPKITVASGP